MQRMTPITRLKVSVVVIIVSAAYGILVAENPELATDVWRAYVAGLLTVLVLVNVWKKS